MSASEEALKARYSSIDKQVKERNAQRKNAMVVEESKENDLRNESGGTTDDTMECDNAALRMNDGSRTELLNAGNHSASDEKYSVMRPLNEEPGRSEYPSIEEKTGDTEINAYPDASKPLRDSSKTSQD